MYCSGRIWLVSLLEISWKTLCVSFISPLTLPCPRHQQREQLGQQTRQRHGGDQDQCRGQTPLHTHQETSTHEHRDHRDDEQHVRGETETKHRPPRQILYVWTFYIGLSCGVAIDAREPLNSFLDMNLFQWTLPKLIVWRELAVWRVMLWLTMMTRGQSPVLDQEHQAPGRLRAWSRLRMLLARQR